MANSMKAVAGILIGLVVVFGLWSYKRGIETRALLKFRADSLHTADSIITELHKERALKDSVLAEVLAQANRDRVAARADMDRFRRIAQRSRTSLDSALSMTPDTVRVLVFETINALENENAACRVALGSCETALALKDSLLASSDSTAMENRRLFDAAQDQLDDAIRAARPSPTAWVQRGLAIVGIVKVVELVFAK